MRKCPGNARYNKKLKKCETKNNRKCKPYQKFNEKNE
jgi:hypothetical protein